MTESEWWAATDLADPYFALEGNHHLSQRKLRLLGVAAVARFRHHLSDIGAKFLQISESYCDGEVNEEEVLERWSVAVAERGTHIHGATIPQIVLDALIGPYRDRLAVINDSSSFALYACDGVVGALDDLGPDLNVLGYRNERLVQVRLLHDIFGPLPFRDVPIDPDWLTSNVLSLARGIYDDKTFDQMAILADALQDAGCDNVEILNHCRDTNQTHVRGCWVLDLLLGRPWREPNGKE